MIVHRLCNKRYAHTALDGEGARLYEGRWNRRGEPVVYLAATISLGMLEILVHAGPDLLPTDYVALPIDLSALQAADFEHTNAASLPPDWNAPMAGDATRALGSRWLTGARTPVLVVPSAVVPQESNYLLNPRHPKAHAIVTGVSLPVIFDPPLRGRPPR